MLSVNEKTKMSHGELLRKLRKERNMSQQMIAEGVSARETLTNFENNKVNSSIQTFLGYLNNLGIDFNEYVYLYNQLNPTEYDRLKSDFFTMIQTKEEASQFIRELECKYVETNKQSYKLLLYQAKLLNNRLYNCNKNDVSHEVSYIQNYLSHFDYWGKAETTLFANTMFAYSTEYIINCYKNFIKKASRYYMRVPQNNEEICNILLNFGYLYIERGQFKMAEDSLLEAKKFAEKNSFTYQLLMVKILLKYVEQPNDFDISHISYEIGILDYLGLESKKEALKTFFESLK